MYVYGRTRFAPDPRHGPKRLYTTRRTKRRACCRGSATTRRPRHGPQGAYTTSFNFCDQGSRQAPAAKKIRIDWHGHKRSPASLSPISLWAIGRRSQFPFTAGPPNAPSEERVGNNAHGTDARQSQRPHGASSTATSAASRSIATHTVRRPPTPHLHPSQLSPSIGRDAPSAPPTGCPRGPRSSKPSRKGDITPRQFRLQRRTLASLSASIKSSKIGPLSGKSQRPSSWLERHKISRRRCCRLRASSTAAKNSTPPSSPTPKLHALCAGSGRPT